MADSGRSTTRANRARFDKGTVRSIQARRPKAGPRHKVSRIRPAGGPHSHARVRTLPWRNIIRTDEFKSGPAPVPTGGCGRRGGPRPFTKSLYLDEALRRPRVGWL